MQKTKKVKETREFEKPVCVICDLCGAESNQPEGWERSSYSSFEGEFKFMDIDHYPGDYQASGFKVDFCPACAKKIFDLLLSMGVKKENCKYESP